MDNYEIALMHAAEIRSAMFEAVTLLLERAAYVLAMRLLQSDIDLEAEEQEAVNLAIETWQSK